MQDNLKITGLKANTHIGIHEWEQRIKQTLLLDIKLPLNFNKIQDNLENTIDYAALCADITSFVESNTFLLIETVAHKVALYIQQQYSVTAVKVRVSKPYAVKNAQNIQVSVALP